MNTTADVQYSRAEVDEVRREDVAAVERLTRENQQMAKERNRAAEHIARIQAENSRLRQENLEIDAHRRNANGYADRARIEARDAQQRIDMAIVALNCEAVEEPRRIEYALQALEPRDLRHDCEICGGPCAVDGKTCLLCNHIQPQPEPLCPPREGEMA